MATMPFVGEEHELVVIVLGRDVSGGLAATLAGVLEAHPHVIYVDDGSTDDSISVAREAGVRVVSLHRPQGLGSALKAGLDLAWELRYRGAISMLGDGTHDPADLPAFVSGYRQAPEAMFLGQRDLTLLAGGRAERIRDASRWISRLAGRTIEDAMCGFRCYPVHSLLRLEVPARSPSFEVEVLVRAASLGVPIYSIPVGVPSSRRSQMLGEPRPLDVPRLAARLGPLCLRGLQFSSASEGRGGVLSPL